MSCSAPATLDDGLGGALSESSKSPPRTNSTPSCRGTKARSAMSCPSSSLKEVSCLDSYPLPEALRLASHTLRRPASLLTQAKRLPSAEATKPEGNGALKTCSMLKDAACAAATNRKADSAKQLPYRRVVFMDSPFCLDQKNS